MVLLADLEDAAEYEPPPDHVPPVLTLKGLAQIELQQLDEYVDEGASAYDADSGQFCEVTAHGLEALAGCLAEATCTTTATGPFIIEYTAADASGNRAQPVAPGGAHMCSRRPSHAGHQVAPAIQLPARSSSGMSRVASNEAVAVASFCAAPSYLCEGTVERVCASCETVAGNTTCVCLSFEVDVVGSVTVEPYEPPDDTVPPVLTLLGEAPLGITASGTVVMLHTMLEGEAWSDPGVAALDDVDGQLSEAVGAFGAGAIDTSLARSDPYTIVYSVSDHAGNAAVEVQRRVYVTNPCADDAAGGSTEGERVCHVDEASRAVTCSESGLCVSLQLEEEEVVVPPDAPVLELAGPSAIEIPEGGEPYAVCPEGGERLGQVCDKGATATDALDGDLTARILACSPDGASMRLDTKGVSACGVDTDVPGVYLVTFSVSNSAGLSAYATRNVTITPACPIGEVLCRSGEACSSDGVCLQDLSGAGGAEDVEEPLPSLSLLSTVAVPGQYVEVKQYQEYVACTEEALAVDPEILCEPGVVAYDAEQREVTAQVIACPPDSCLGKVKCDGHEWLRKGLQGCLNTSAEVGTVFNVSFTVFSTGMPAQSVNVTRYVSIIQPCELGEELCEDRTCSDVDCATRDAWAAPPPDVTPPIITLRRPSPAQIIYGNASAAGELRACTQLDLAELDPPCLATAQDDVSGDVSATLTATQDTACEGCSRSGCALERVHQCFPGTYGFLYVAEDEEGNRGVVRLLVAVVEAAVVDSETILSTGTRDAAEAQAQAALLLDASSPEAQTFVAGLVELLNSAARTGDAPFTPHDIRITGATVQQPDGQEQQRSEELNLVVSFATLVEVEGDAGGAEGRRLLQEDGGSPLTLRTDDVASIITTSAQDGQMSLFLEEAGAATNTSLGSVEGLARDVESEPLSPEVDEELAYEASIQAEVEALREGGTQMGVSLQGTRESLAAAPVDGNEWEARVTETWVEGQQGDFANMDALLASIAELKARYKLLASAAELVQDDAVGAAVALQQASESFGNITGVVQQITEFRLEVQARAAADQEVDMSVYASAPSHPSLTGCGGAAQGTSEELRYSFIVPGPADPHNRSIGRRRMLVEEGTEGWYIPTTPENTPPRYLGLRRNLIVGGIMCQAWWGEEFPPESCSERFEHIRAPCFTTPAAPGYYGHDPVFSPASSLFSPELQSDKGKYYDISPGSDMVNEHGHPLPFAPRSLSSSSAQTSRGYPFYVDTRVGERRAEELHTFLQEAPVVDETTSHVEVSLMTWNSHAQYWAVVRLTWERPERGEWEVSAETLAMRVGYWSWATWPDTVWLLLHVTWALIAIVAVFHELRKLLPEWDSNSDVSSFFLRLEYTLLSYLHGGVEQVLHLLKISVGATVIFIFVLYHVLMLFVVDIDKAYEVYHNLNAAANFFLSARTTPALESLGGVEGGVTGAASDYAWALPEDNDGLATFVEKLNLVRWMGALDRWVALLQAAWVFFAMTHLLVVMRPQQTLRVIVDATWSSLTTQLNLIAFYVCLMSFAVVFNLCLGPKHEAFTTVNKSLTKMSLFAYVGDFDRDDWNMVEAWESGALEYTGEKIFSLTFLCAYYFLLSQIQFALVHGAAYLAWAGAPDIADKTIPKELINIGQCFVLRRLGRWPRPGHLLRVLRVLRVLQDKKMEDRRFQSMFMILDRLSVLMREEKAAPQHVVVNGQELSRGELVAVLQHRAESCARRSQRTMMQRATQGVQAQPRSSMSFYKYLVPKESEHGDEPLDKDLDLISQYFAMSPPRRSAAGTASGGALPQMSAAARQRSKVADRAQAWAVMACPTRPSGLCRIASLRQALAAHIITRLGTDHLAEDHSDDLPSASAQPREQLRQQLDTVISNNATTLQHYDTLRNLLTKLLERLAAPPSEAAPLGRLQAGAGEDHSEARSPSRQVFQQGVASVLASLPNIQAESPKNLSSSQRVSSGGYLPRAASVQQRHYASRKMWELFDPSSVETQTFTQTTWALSPSIIGSVRSESNDDLLPACYPTRERDHAPTEQTRSGERKLRHAGICTSRNESPPEVEHVVASPPSEPVDAPPPLEPVAPSKMSEIPATPPSVIRFREKTLKDTIIEMPQNECNVEGQPTASTVPSEPALQFAAAEDQQLSETEKKKAKRKSRKSVVVNSSAEPKGGARQDSTNKKKKRRLRRF
ncbi:hypothetical protein CYMTET_52282 [Cymbomonas tetramitiformis]|uniref:Pesticidal crystal protein Cry22Aa Ig-like domain-containing protein n=1 Tax=Cymbomonas tetramitiformis TaxID=36881 RepID=A0AAE0BJJ7_9CHLO|nr:hypothetical protein CYMTET_52282 [Cymbomonas tetramitiformis]